MENIPSTNIPLIIKNNIEEIDNDYSDKEILQNFQYIVKEYVINSDNRGLLVFHSPGTGKSILASSIIDHIRKHDPKRKIIILLSKSLKSNFERNIKKFMKMNPYNSQQEKKNEFIDETLDKFKFISLNASNMFTQISKVSKTKEEIEFEKQWELFNEYASQDFLENSLLIVDEFHNLSNSITNGSSNAVKLYNTIMNTKNIKMLFLTGTPIINNPFELVPTFNMLKGFIKYNYGGKIMKTTLFPESKSDFRNFFIETNVGSYRIKNKNKFQNRIFGMISYYGDFYFGEKTKEGFPEQKNLIIEKIPMSMTQFSRYQEARDIEIKEEANKFKKGSQNDFFSIKEDMGAQSSYRIRSRQISNYCIPEYALTFKKSRTTVTKHIEKITDSDLKNLTRFSPKFEKMIDNIKKHEGQLGVVYSEFVSGEGLKLFTMALEAKENYTYWEKNNTDFSADEYDIKLNKSKKSSKNKTYALITGDIVFTERQHIINIFNGKDNIDGDIISLLLISKSGAEGLNLKNVRHIHIMEPFWNYARIEQVIARGVRFHSHTLLDKKNQNVQPYIYISTYPTSFNKKMIKEKTTDEELWHSSLVGKKLINDFEISMIETSIDCSINYENLSDEIKQKFKCKLCSPNNDPLYNIDLFQDIDAADPCQEISAINIETHEIKLENNTYRYSKNKDIIKIYQYDKDIGAYIPMLKNNPIYPDILKKILKI